MHALTEQQIERYGRQIILDEVGEEGQLKLLNSRVVIAGLGGLGSASAYYLAAAGVGTLRLIDPDQVELSNLQRQIIHSADDAGRPKVSSAAETISALNPDVRVEAECASLTSANVRALLAGADIVIDGSDSYDTRSLLNDAVLETGQSFIVAALQRFEGQITTLRPGREENSPCYHCIFPRMTDMSRLSRCDIVGVFGSVAGVLGSMQAAEAVKELLNIGNSLVNRLLLLDFFDWRAREIRTKKRPDCQICGNRNALPSAGCV